MEQILQRVQEYGPWGFLPKCQNVLPTDFSHYKVLIDKLRKPNFAHIVDHFNIVYGDQVYQDIDHFHNLKEIEIRYLYSVFSMMVAVYKVQHDCVYVPKCLGLIWKRAADHLGLPLVLTHASVDLYNWSFIEGDQEIMAPEQLMINNRMTDYYDEDWFYIIMIAIEGLSGEFMSAMINCDYHAMAVILNRANDYINKIDEYCDPDIFFHKLRPYLAGHTDLVIEGLDERFTFVGGSAAQSSFIQLVDIVLRNGKQHEGHELKFLTTMRDYMPKKDREFLELVEKHYVSEPTNQHYMDAVEAFVRFRKSHLRIVHKYITNVVKKSENCVTKVIKQICKITERGTGGTSYGELLSNIINTTISRIRV